ncbi:MAG: NADH-quinone oxidoreductase subunit N [Anaerolineales bacterium]|nr:NADH-quinone oxidoreductase subunit N [Anaerolineales bacterium]MCW5855185.1 NADH-quinone oxidoreductase subunit N [Anaerolineales bacterium]
MFSSITADMLLAILPEISLLLLMLVVFVADLVLHGKNSPLPAWITIGGLGLTLLATIAFAQPAAQPQLLWGGMLRHDWLAFIFKVIFLFSALLVTLLTVGWQKLWYKGEYYILLLASTMGMTLMGASADLVMLFLAIETTSIPLYILAGFVTTDRKSNEAGFKYLLFGAVTTGIMLYGFSLLYGFAGTTNLYGIASGMAASGVPIPVIVGALLLVLVGFGFKVSMAPLHFWAPDVYEGSPTPITAFLSTASKAAGLAVLMRVMLAAFPGIQPEWQNIIAVGSALTMTIGNLIALSQHNIKRLLAYSSIAHAGYSLLAVAAASELGVLSVVYYLLVYTVTQIAAFAVVIVVSNVTGSDEIADFAGLHRRNPMLALALLLSFLSLAGIPPLGGFIAKVLAFAAAVQAGLIWLAVVGVLNSIVGLYYYLIVLKVAYLDEPKGEAVIAPSRPQAATLVVSIVLVLILGVVIAPWYNWAASGAGGLF